MPLSKIEIKVRPNHQNKKVPVRLEASESQQGLTSLLLSYSKVLREVDDAVRIVLVLERREVGGVRGIVALVRFIRRVRAIDVIDYDEL